MRALLLLAAISVSTTAAAEDPPSTQEEWKADWTPEMAAKELRVGESYVDARLAEPASTQCAATTGPIPPYKNLSECSSESAGKIGEISYKLSFLDYSGAFSNRSSPRPYSKGTWDVSCGMDRMHDSRSCTISSGTLTVYLGEKGHRAVWVGGQKYPYSRVYMRFSGGKAIESMPTKEGGSFTPAQVSMIISGLKKGIPVTHRHTNWPYQANIDENADTEAFSQAYAYADWLFKKLKK